VRGTPGLSFLFMLNFVSNIWSNKNYPWLLLRFGAVWLVPSLLLFFFFFLTSAQTVSFDVYNCTSLLLLFKDSLSFNSAFVQFFFVLTAGFLFLHIFYGIEEIIQDYVHHEKSRQFCFFLLLLTQIESFKYLYIFMLFS
jgi:succinate dehydrogenase hydrophobic anchor subunit